LILHNNQKVVTRITKVSDYQIETVRKDIKNIHLGVYPPNGRIRISVPLRTSDDGMRLFIISKIPWIKKQRERFAKQERQTKRQFISGESHYLFGKRYILNIHKTNQKASIQIQRKTKLNFYVKLSSTTIERQRIFEKFYRRELEKLIPNLMTKWEKMVGVKTRDVRIKKMKTKWGTCNSKNKRIWLNLELAKKAPHTALIMYLFMS
jgi:predicted metal-dependent hydrolase